GADAASLHEKLHAVHPRHHVVGNDQPDGSLPQLGECHLGTEIGGDLESLGLEHALDRAKNEGIVVHHEDSPWLHRVTPPAVDRVVASYTAGPIAARIFCCLT